MRAIFVLGLDLRGEVERRSPSNSLVLSGAVVFPDGSTLFNDELDEFNFLLLVLVLSP